jgi:hypothetical protein
MRRIFAARFVPDEDWLAPELISDPKLAYPAGEPAVAVAPGGNAVAVWLQTVGENKADLWAARYLTYGGWTAARPVLSLPRGLAVAENMKPAVGIDAQGRAIVVWIEEDQESRGLWAAHLE